MKSKEKLLLDRFSHILEFVIACILIIGILYFTVQLFGGVLHIPGFNIPESFESLMSNVFALVIGVEIVRMMCEHELSIVFEVLTFAIARQMVISHGHAIDNLIGVAALGILLFIKKKYEQKE